MALFQLRQSLEARWGALIDRMSDWLEEGLAVGLAIRMARAIAGRDGDPRWPGYSSHWGHLERQCPLGMGRVKRPLRRRCIPGQLR